MPYINQELKRRSYKKDQPLSTSLFYIIRTIKEEYTEDEIEGVLNYCISRLINETLGKDGWRYKKINRAIGVLECAKQEFYRRVAIPYEDKAIDKNGDIY